TSSWRRTANGWNWRGSFVIDEFTNLRIYELSNRYQIQFVHPSIVNSSISVGVLVGPIPLLSTCNPRPDSASWVRAAACNTGIRGTMRRHQIPGCPRTV